MNWKKEKLEDVADFCLRKMLDQKKNKGELRPYLANINVRWGEFEFDSLREMRFEQHELDRFGLKFGDIVMCEGGEPGRCAIWKDQVPGMMIQKALHRIRPHKCLNNKFLFYIFLEKGQTQRFSSLFTGATIKHLPREKLAKVEVEVPPLSLQRKIASILSAYDDLIENNSRRIAILEEMAQAIYREWFVNFRFPGHENVKLVDSPLGMIPDGWNVSKLRDICDLVNYGYTASANKAVEVGPRFLRITDIVPTMIDWENVPYCELSQEDTGKYLLSEGDIVIARTGATTGYAKRLNKRHPKTVFASYLVRIRPKFAVVGQHYVGVIVESAEYKEFVRRNLGGSAQPQANAQVLTSLDILVPTIAVISAFDALVAPVTDQRETLSVKNRNLRKTRDLLLPKLISGQLDVEELDIDLGLITDELQETTA